MSDFSYNLPFSNDRFMNGIKGEIKRRGETQLYYFLKNAKLSVDELGTSYYVNGTGRWNAIGVNIKFYLNPSYLNNIDNEKNRDILFEICNSFIPGDVGYDLKGIIFVADLTIDTVEEDDIVADLENQIKFTSNSILKKILPEEIISKGQEMSEAYTYLYSVENSLRLFIEIIAKEKYGDEYFSKLTVTTSLRNTISSRKTKASQKKWLSVRGNSDLFYLDFKDLGTLINSNWNIFKDYFSSQDFIIPKLNEMAECRNLIAHNSYISKTERDLIKSYYNSIIMQISDKFESDEDN